MKPAFTETAMLWLPVLPAVGLGIGLVLLASGAAGPAGAVFTLATLPVLLALLWQVFRTLGRAEAGLDLIAAMAMVGALLLGEALAGAVVALMFSGGQFLEASARNRARREMTALLARQPRHATRHTGDGGLEQVPLAALRPSDRVLVRQGEVVPVDGTLADAAALLDTAALTGEAMPVKLARGAAVMSGSTNAGEAFDLLATHEAAASTYAGIIRLVEQAQAGKAPMARLADRWAQGFLLLTLALAGAAWAFTGDPLRALAVLVVATPCPLILAVPVAIIAGLSRAAKAGVLVKSGAALEALARVRVLLLDKTGTLTEGRARLVALLPCGEMTEAELLRLAASLDQASGHVIAANLVVAAKARGLVLAVPQAVRESAGAGISGLVEGRAVAVGGEAFILEHLGETTALPAAEDHAPGAVRVQVAIDGAHAGTMVFADALRPDARDMLAAARAAGIARVVMVSGDQASVAEAIGLAAGVDLVLSGHSPAQKVAVVLAERRHGPVLMVGDGVNDAPALAAADVGVAMGAQGAAASAEAADAVVLVDRIDRLAEAMRIARRARHIALQSVAAGIGLSLAAMVAAAFGTLTPVQGAVLQEAIDVAVILNALRALRG